MRVFVRTLCKQALDTWAFPSAFEIYNNAKYNNVTLKPGNLIAAKYIK